LARAKSQDELIKFGANEVIAAFNLWLLKRSEYGIVIVDRLASVSEYRYLVNKFCTGLDLQTGESMRLERVKLFASSCINASHASSAMDIMLGAFRYCINQPRNLPAARKMMSQVIRLIWHRREGDEIVANGLIFRPKNIRSAKYQNEYEALLAWINKLIKGT
jgi:hypothetical protein